MRWKLFADLGEVAGGQEVEVELPDTDGAPTVDDALAALLDARPALADRVLEDGELREHINLLHNGRNVGDEGLTAPVEPDDELALFPPVSGG